MRQTCQISYKGQGIDWVCGKPAVDFVEKEEGRKFWLCADHFDLMHRIRKILLDADGERDYKYRPPKPGKVIE